MNQDLLIIMDDKKRVDKRSTTETTTAETSKLHQMQLVSWDKTP